MSRYVYTGHYGSACGFGHTAHCQCYICYRLELCSSKVLCIFGFPALPCPGLRPVLLLFHFSVVVGLVWFAFGSGFCPSCAVQRAISWDRLCYTKTYLDISWQKKKKKSHAPACVVSTSGKPQANNVRLVHVCTPLYSTVNTLKYWYVFDGQYICTDRRNT